MPQRWGTELGISPCVIYERRLVHWWRDLCAITGIMCKPDRGCVLCQWKHLRSSMSLCEINQQSPSNTLDLPCHRLWTIHHCGFFFIFAVKRLLTYSKTSSGTCTSWIWVLSLSISFISVTIICLQLSNKHFLKLPSHKIAIVPIDLHQSELPDH